MYDTQSLKWQWNEKII